MKTKHTPGPWKWIGSRQSPKERIYLSTPDGYVNWTDLHSAEATANARLIAAAPELLAALEKMLRLHYKTAKASLDGSDAVNKATEAIAKAKGA